MPRAGAGPHSRSLWVHPQPWSVCPPGVAWARPVGVGGGGHSGACRDPSGVPPPPQPPLPQDGGRADARGRQTSGLGSRVLLSSAPLCQSWPHAGAVPSSGSGPAPHLLDSWKSDASTLIPGSRAASRLPWSALGQAAARALTGARALGAGGQRSYRPSCPVSRLFSRLTPELPGGQAAPPHSLRQVQFRSAEQSGLDALRPRPRCCDLGQGGARRGTSTPPRTAADPALPRGPRAWGTSGAAGSGGWSGPCN